MRAQALHIGAVGRVGPPNPIAQIVHDLGDAAHADAADADEMDRADVEGNARRRSGHHAPPIRSTRSARRAAASGFARGMRSSRALCQIAGRGEGRLQHLGEFLRREVLLRHAPAAAGIGERIGIGRLIVVERMRQRHEDCGSADHHQLRNRARARTADDEMRFRHASREIVEERRKFRHHAARLIRGAHAFQVFRTALLHDVEPRARIGGQYRNRRRHDLAERPRALAAAEHEQTQRTARRRRIVRRVLAGHDFGAHGIAGVDDL